MAYPIYQSTGGIGAGTDYSCDVPYPSTVNADDILIVAVMDADNDTFDIPAGWTKFDEDSSSNNMSFALYWKRADGTETGTETFTSLLNAGALVAGIMYRYSGCVKYGTPLRWIISNPINQSNTCFVVFGPNDPDALQRLAVGIGIVEDNTINGFTPAADTFTEDSRLSTSVGSDAHFGACSLEVGATAPASPNWSMSASEYKVGISLYLIPEGDVPVTLNSPDDLEDIGDDTTPTVEFTPNAPSDLDNEVEVQIDTVNTFDSVDNIALLAEYDETNESAIFAFTELKRAIIVLGDGKNINKASFYIHREGTTPSGRIRVGIYNTTSDEPTGDNIAYSELIDVSSLGGSNVWVDFSFLEDNIITLENGTTYAIALETFDFSFDSDINEVQYGVDTSAPSYPYLSWTFISSWNSSSSDTIFKVFTGQLDPLINALSETPDAGFLNTVNGGDTHPFNDNEKISFTVQGGDELPYGTVYWRVRAINPTGINVFDDWSATRSFDITEVSGLNMSINIGDTWKDVVLMKINIGDTWKDVVAIKINIGDVWKDV